MDKVKQLEQDIITLCRENKLYQPFQVGGYIISPIHYGEEEDGSLVVDTESMMEEFEQSIDSVDFNFLEWED